MNGGVLQQARAVNRDSQFQGFKIDWQTLVGIIQGPGISMDDAAVKRIQSGA